MKILVWSVLATVINYSFITTVVDVILLGRLHVKSGRGCRKGQFLIERENRIDLQERFECSAYSSAFCLRHWGIEAEGPELYQKMPNKMKNGYVYPKGIQNLLPQYGFRVTYCIGTLSALKKEVAKGNPVIVLIRVRSDKNWLHYVPVVGFDENYIFLAESLKEFVNCDEKYYNRAIEIDEFKKLWNTSMIKMPFYRNTYMVVEKKEQK